MRRLAVAHALAFSLTFSLLLPLAALGADSASKAVAEQADDAAAQAHDLFERDWHWRLEHDPEYATGIGEHRYDAALSDLSPDGAKTRTAHARQMREAALRIDPERLGAQDRLSWTLFVDAQERHLATAAVVPFDPLPIHAQDGLHVRLPRLVAQMPFVTEADYDRYLARLHALPRHVDGLVETLRAGLKTGWVAPQAIVAPVPDELRVLRTTIKDNAVGAPLRRLPGTIDPDARARIARDGEGALADAAAALQTLEDFLRADYVPAARATIAAGSLPGGQAWYALLVRQATTTALSPADIHALGLQETARLRDAMAALAPRTGFRGTLPEFIAFARGDARLFPKDADALLARYRRTVARAAGALPRVFNGADALPELAVKPAMAGDSQGGAYYEAETAARMAALVIDTSRLDARPLWETETLALHEGVPGHHLQIARAQALALPAFRRHAWYPAFGEGWALYAEILGPELGIASDPFSAFGRLADEQLRAARLVVDTGIHALGWTRRQAIDWLDRNTANPPADNVLEVDRCIAQPGQALAYKIGQLRIAALRREAEMRLGERFDVRAFHDAVLGNGAVPLDQLQRQVETWISAQTAPEK